MKDLEKLYQTVMGNRQIMAEFVKASATASLEAFAEKYSCTATEDEIRNYFRAQCEGEIPDDEVDAVSGCMFDFSILFRMKFGDFQPGKEFIS